MKNNTRIAVVIPCYKVKKHIKSVIASLNEIVSDIYVVDDACPEKSGEFVKQNVTDSRVKVLFHEKNLGVGGAVMTGYKYALNNGADIIIKLDGDGQMDSSYIPKLIAPILNGEADYTKGNRFFNIEELLVMPRIRLFGNSILSIINKVVTGYWDIIDPTNGYTAIHASVLKHLPLHKINNRYFFESDMLFRLSIARAVVKDIAMPAIYEDEESNLSIRKIIWEFPLKYLNRFFKRIFYNYFLRDFNAGTIQLFFGIIAVIIGSSFGIYHWIRSVNVMEATPTGTIMIATLLIILGFQMLLGALNFDVQNTPNSSIQNT